MLEFHSLSAMCNLSVTYRLERLMQMAMRDDNADSSAEAGHTSSNVSATSVSAELLLCCRLPWQQMMRGWKEKKINGGKTNQRMTCVKGRCASQNKEKSEKKDELEDGGVREG